MTVLEILTLVGTLLNTGILTGIWYKLGRGEEKHDSHERRFEIIERKIGIC